MPDDQSIVPKRKRASKADQLHYVATARKLLETRAHENDIVKVVCNEYSLEERDAKKYIRLARAEILADTMRAGEEHIADAFSFYLGVVRDRKQKLGDRLRAQDRIDRLLAQAADRTNQNVEERETAAQLQQQIELIANHLIPLGLVEAHYPIEEHARVAAEILIQHGLAQLPEASGEGPPT